MWGCLEQEHRDRGKIRREIVTTLGGTGLMKRLGLLFVVFAAAMGIAAGAMAEDNGLPPGTVITHANWQQYRNYMTAGEIGMWEATNPTIDVPPNAKVVIGPTKSYPLNSAYWDATEKYSKQVSLVKVDTGAYTIKGYVAGMPFPNLSPQDPEAGYKLMYDIYFQYYPAVKVQDHMQVLDVDKYGNLSFLHALSIAYTIDHLTDPGYPSRIPGTIDGLYYSSLAEQLDPEQIKYVTAVNFTWDDPTRFPEAYVFLPSIRRAIRLSSAARCAPFQGQDFANDDTTPVPLPPTWFDAHFLGVKKIMIYISDPSVANKVPDRANYYPGGTSLFPKPEVLGPWQLRDVYVLQLQRLPQFMRGYCYSKRLMYLGKENVGTMAWDDWDQNGKLWRVFVNILNPFKNGNGWYLNPWAHNNPDFQNWHQSLLLPPAKGTDASWVNHQTPGEYVNYTRYATPAGLQQIMQ